VLAQNEPNQKLKDRALWHSLSLKRLDFIQLLVTYGAQLSSVPFIEVLRIWEPTIIRFFLDHGADFVQGSPFAVAFGERIRTAIAAWRECREKHPEFASQLQEQADRALRHFCEKEDLKWVSLLMWAGADPRSSGPTLDDDDEDLDDPASRTAIAAAAYAKNLQILKRLKPDTELDDLNTLLTNAATFGRVDSVRYLLELGANPNDKPNGGSAAFDRCSKEIWSEPTQHVAKRYHLSDVGLAKVCKKLNIPRRGRGYWAMKAAGKPVPRQPPLPKLTVE
jgi:Ankyrin repeats (3 copies)